MVSKGLLALVLSAISLTGVEARVCIKRSSGLSLTDLLSLGFKLLSSPSQLRNPATSFQPVQQRPRRFPRIFLRQYLATTPSTSLSDLPATPSITPSTDALSTTPVIAPSTDLPATTPEVTFSTIASSSTPEVTSSTVVPSLLSFEQGVNPWINSQGAVASSSGAVTARDGNSYFLATLTGSNNFISVRQSLQLEIGQTYEVKAYYGLGARQNFGTSGVCNLQLTMGGELQGSVINLTPAGVGQWNLFERTYVATDTNVVIRYVLTCSGVTSVDGLLELVTVPSIVQQLLPLLPQYPPPLKS
ncbi:unnamed protein product [Clonostachys rhizophaga]|uniref:CBM-cenC domain-containing protein n=1 Tax=Clonostachys rhizophaga TaxID=160324 RepID=A0A9N9VRB1_9HYPO|nr:unnamed protein product [Clonostachys rhizophaga]